MISELRCAKRCHRPLCNWLASCWRNQLNQFATGSAPSRTSAHAITISPLALSHRRLALTQKRTLSGKFGKASNTNSNAEKYSQSVDDDAASKATTSTNFAQGKSRNDLPTADMPPSQAEVAQAIAQTRETNEKKQKQQQQFSAAKFGEESGRHARNSGRTTFAAGESKLPGADSPPDRSEIKQLFQSRADGGADILSPKKHSHDPVIFYEAGSKCRIILNRPKQLNAQNLSMIRSIQPHLLKWDKSPDMNAIIIKSDLEKAFCAGGDVVSVARSIIADDPEMSRHKQDFFREEYTMNYTIGQLSVPYIAIIDGITMGGGVGLSVHGKFRVATERTVFAMPETGIGFFPDVGGTYVLSRLEGGLGTFLALTGYRLKGQDAWHARIATHFCSSSLLQELDQALLNLPVSADEAAICAKLDEFEHRSLDDANTTIDERDASTTQSRAFSLHPYRNVINTVFEHADTVEDIFARLLSSELEHPEWRRSVYDTLQKMSPTSLKVSLRALREAAQKASLKECLQMEFRISQRFCDKNVTTDFYEGVRALLIDKDSRGAQWSPGKVEQVADDLVDKFFQPLDRHGVAELELV